VFQVKETGRQAVCPGASVAEAHERREEGEDRGCLKRSRFHLPGGIGVLFQMQ
jgi:hypothetical protein